MRHEILASPAYSLVEVSLDSGESVVADSGAMAWMDPNIRTQTTTRGGVLKGLKRAFLAGESFFQNTYTAEGGSGRVGLAPGCSGNIVVREMRGDELVLEKGAYLASSPDVVCDSKFDGFKGLFNEGFFVLRVTGTGTLFFHSYGDIHEVDVDGEYVVDNGFAVAWEPSLSYRISKARKIRSFLFSDQLLLRFSGRGRLWVQSRSPRSLASWVYPFRPQRKDNS